MPKKTEYAGIIYRGKHPRIVSRSKSFVANAVFCPFQLYEKCLHRIFTNIRQPKINSVKNNASSVKLWIDLHTYRLNVPSIRALSPFFRRPA